MSDDVQLVTFTEAAKLLGLHVNTLRQWASKGVLTTVKLGTKARRIPVSELRRLIQQGLDAAVED